VSLATAVDLSAMTEIKRELSQGRSPVPKFFRYASETGCGGKDPSGKYLSKSPYHHPVK